jgi:hypothetical protein
MALLSIGQRVGQWRVSRFIDEGGNGEVWEVSDAEGRRAAMKVLIDRRAESVAYRRFRREIETVRGLGDRTGVLPILDAHLPEQPSRRNRAWYVMPVAQRLESALEGESVQDVVAAVAAIAAVLAELHELGIAHRDIKPANLLWLDDGPVLADFGLVHVPEAESLTEPGRVPGAFGYIADEVMQELETARPELADVFALAKVLWKLLVPGAAFPPQGPLRADGGPSTLERSLTAARADALDRILEAATRAQPARIDMADFLTQLRAWLELAPAADMRQDLAAALTAARSSMARSMTARDEATARREAAEGARQVLVRSADELFDAVRTIDPAGAQAGRMAIGGLNRLIEQSAETGSRPYGPPFHHGIRLTREGDLGEVDVLIVAFCLQVTQDDLVEGAVTGLLMAGDENSTDSELRVLPTLYARAGIELESAVEQAVAASAAQLGAILEYFATRATP